MAVKGATLVTMADVAKLSNKYLAKPAEVLVKHNAMLKDIPFTEMNEGTIHKESIRDSLPAVYYRKANQAIPASKSVTSERTFTAAHFESKSVMDVAVASRGGQERISWNRWVQAEGHLQAHAHEHASLMIYGSPIDSSQKVPGFMDILSTLNTGEPTYNQVIDAGGTGSDNCSILKVHWGIQSVFGIYERGSQYGLKRTDHGKQKIQGTTSTGAAGEFWGFEEQFETDHGLVVKDYRQIARVCNIDVSDLVAGSGADLIDLMISADYKIDSKENGQGVWYCNRTVEAHLHKQALTKVGAGAGLRFDNYQGEKVLMFLDCPVRRSDSMLNSESRVTTATTSWV